MAGPVGVHPIAGIGEQLVRVRAEIVALGLDEIGGQCFASIAVVEGQRRAKARQRHAQQDAVGDYLTPIVLCSFPTPNLYINVCDYID